MSAFHLDPDDGCGEGIADALEQAPVRKNGVRPSRPLLAGLIRRSPVAAEKSFSIGILEGEGVGPELLALCVELLHTISRVFGRPFEIRTGGPIGLPSERLTGRVLSEEVCEFCHSVFAEGGAILAGPGGGRFVYEMRRRFGLFVKLNPLASFPELADVSRLRATASPVDLLIVRENLGGLYQGASRMELAESGRRIEHRFECAEAEIRQLVAVAAQLARQRRKHLTVVAKESGLSAMSQLWFDCGRKAAAEAGVAVRTMDVDFAAYQLIARPEEFDVLAVPNCFGDILADLGGLFCGSRGSTYGASFSMDGAAVYQTNHGAAYDLAGTDTANPAGQIFALSMMLRESFGLAEEAAALEGALRQAWREGWRTADLMAAGCRLATTTRMGELVADRLEGARLVSSPEPA